MKNRGIKTLGALAIIGLANPVDAQIKPIINLEASPSMNIRAPEHTNFSFGANTGIKIKNWSFGAGGGAFLPINHQKGLTKVTESTTFSYPLIISDQKITELYNKDLFHFGVFAGFENFRAGAGIKVNEEKTVTTHNRFTDGMYKRVIDINTEKNKMINPYFELGVAWDQLDHKKINQYYRERENFKKFNKKSNKTYIGLRVYPKNREVALTFNYDLIKK
jgi:hypothetical protein